ncbi:MAG: hypothetical protein PHF84_04195 [bacterium]|nr:hypothetical protein [bacterium]
MFNRISRIIFFILFFVNLLDAVPNMLNYRGKVFENGIPVSGTRTLRFRIYNQLTSGILLWDSGDQALDVNNGYYYYTMTGVPASVFTNDSRFLEVSVGGSLLAPREQLVSVGYAYNAAMLNGVPGTNINLWSRNGANIYRLTGNIGLRLSAPSQQLEMTGNLRMPLASTSSNAGVIFIGNSRFLFGIPTYNLFMGESAGSFSLTGDYNTGIGYTALSSLTSGADNVAVGYQALPNLTTGANNVGLGYRALYSLLTGSGNVAIGLNALYNQTGSYCVAVGGFSSYNVTGSYNIGIGYYTMYGTAGSTGTGNVGIGYYALQPLNAGTRNIAVGYNAGNSITDGSDNVLVGAYAGQALIAGLANTFLGSYAGYSTLGSSNVCIGYRVGYSDVGSGKLFIDNYNTSTPLIWGDFNNDYVNINGRLGVGTNAPANPFFVNGPFTGYVAYIKNINASAAGNGLYIDADSYDYGTSSALYGEYIKAYAPSVGGNAYGLCVYSYAYNTSTSYGVYVNATGGSTTGREWGLYVTSGDNYFSGDVGIGTIATTNRLQVLTSSAAHYAAYFANTANADTAFGIGIQAGRADGASFSKLVRFFDGDADAEIGNIGFSGTTITYGTFTGSHYGECDDMGKFEPGDVLVMTGRNSKVNPGARDGEPVYGVEFSSRPDDKRVIGVFGAKTSISRKDKNKTVHEKEVVVIYAVGNCYVKVTDANGDIETGDYLTTSGRPGMAQKQKEAMQMNFTLGKAQETVRWKDVEIDAKKGYKWKLIPIALTAG